MSNSRDRHRPEGGHGHGPKPAPNVKPKPEQRISTKEDQRRRERASRARRSRSNDSERAERGRRSERERGRGEWRRRGRSEEPRKRDRGDGEGERRKAARPPEDDVEDTECAVCFCAYDNVFRTPKLLVCGHTFCLECLARINVTSPELKTLSCPVCRELTEIPHGQDLPRLDNNQDIIGKLPPDMQRALSIRFKRSKGKLLLKNPPPPPVSPTKPNALSLPAKTQDGAVVVGGGDPDQSPGEQRVASATVVDVGRPPNRVRGRLRRLFRSDRCYYAVVASVITVTVALMLVGILAFIIVPNIAVQRPPGNPGNQTSQSPSGAGGGSTP